MLLRLLSFLRRTAFKGSIVILILISRAGASLAADPEPQLPFELVGIIKLGNEPKALLKVIEGTRNTNFVRLKSGQSYGNIQVSGVNVHRGIVDFTFAQSKQRLSLRGGTRRDAEAAELEPDWVIRMER
jgi:hypothetical protein